jgi:hypothetical protein
MWDISTETRPRAKKAYNCNAAECILNSGYDEADFEKEDWDEIERALECGFMILPGEEYIKVSGLWDGEWSTFRARPELNRICHDYGLYE